MAEIDRADFFFTPGGPNALRQVKDCTPSDEATLEPIIPEGSDDVVGAVSKPGAKYYELTCWPNTTPERDYAKYRDNRELCTFTVQYRSGPLKGKRRQSTVRVAEVTDPEGSAGEYTYKVKLLVIGKIQNV